MIQFLPIQGETRPDRQVSAGKKDDVYHAQMTRWLMSSVNPDVINRFRYQGQVNSKFFAGDQWFLREDVDTFLMDGTQDARNRLKVAFNMIRVIVEKYRGTSQQMTFNARARATTYRSVTRRHQQLAELLNMRDLAQMSSMIAGALKEVYPIQDSEQETVALFENTYRDKLIVAINHLIDAVVANPDNQMNKNNAQEAYDLATYGVDVSHAVTAGSHQVFERVDPAGFFWDTSARLYDLTDGDFMGYIQPMSTSEIYERYDVPEWQRSAIEEALSGRYGYLSGYDKDTYGIRAGVRPSVVHAVWKDIMYSEIGYVMGPDGLPEKNLINYLPPGSPKGAKPKYTDKDLIDPPETIECNKFFKGKKKRKVVLETARECDMIPWEFLYGYGVTTTSMDRIRDTVPKENQLDVVLRYGLCEGQEVYPLDSARVKVPIKASVWALGHDGCILTPVSDTIVPQRFFNRIMSVVEQQYNNAGGKGMIVDNEMLTVPGVDEAEANRRMKRGESIPVNPRGRGANNAFVPYDNTPGAGTHGYLQVMQELIGFMRTISATPEAITGTAMNDQLVRTTELMIEKAQTLDEPFYAAMTRLKMQQYQYVATAGKAFYLERPDVLKDLVSQDDMLAILLSSDAALERHQIEVVRSNMNDVIKRQTQEAALLMLQIGALDQRRFVEVYNSGTNEDLVVNLREYAAELASAQKEQQRQEAKANMAQELALRDAQLQQQADQLYEQEVDAAKQADEEQNRLDQIAARGDATMAVDDNAAMNEAAMSGMQQ